MISSLVVSVVLGCFTVAAAQLPPEIMVDRFLLKAEQSIREEDYAGARAAMERILSLQKEHGLEAAPEDHFRYAKVWQASGAPERALESLTRYLQLRGREADHYTEALELMNRAEADMAGPPGSIIDYRGAIKARTEAQPTAADRGPGPAPTGPAGMEFVRIPAGEFLMGSTSGEAVDNERPVTRVRISEGSYLGKYEVTQSEWQAVMGTNPSEFSGCGAVLWRRSLGTMCKSSSGG